jgi:hypothetical protein
LAPPRTEPRAERRAPEPPRAPEPRAPEPRAPEPRAPRAPDALEPGSGARTQPDLDQWLPAAAEPPTEIDDLDSGTDSAAPEDVVELHVDVGRRDGVRERTIRGILVDGGIPVASLRRVRVRERYCFVEVIPEARDLALEVLNAASMDDRRLRASISSRSGKD